ncbi:unnamed protein product, partial [Amoebophrya sp. A120]
TLFLYSFALFPEKQHLQVPQNFGRRGEGQLPQADGETSRGAHQRGVQGRSVPSATDAARRRERESVPPSLLRVREVGLAGEAHPEAAVQAPHEDKRPLVPLWRQRRSRGPESPRATVPRSRQRLGRGVLGSVGIGRSVAERTRSREFCCCIILVSLCLFAIDMSAC